MTQRGTTLGYHYPGDYHFFVRVAHADRFLGQAESSRVRDVGAAIGLVTGMHEHVHLIQSRTCGFLLWLDQVKDEVATAVGQVVGEARGIGGTPPWHRPEVPPSAYTTDGSAFGNAVYASYARDQAENFLHGSGVTAGLLDAEADDAPNLRQWFPGEAWTLTTHDLLEAQAAMAAEWQLEKLMRLQPNQVDPKAADSASGSFRVAALPATYGKALHIITHLLDRMGITVRPASAGVATRIPRGELYPLTIFLLDYALHTPPDPLEMRASFNNDTAAMEDIHPPFRFLMLSLLTALEMAKGKHSVADPDDFYGPTDAHLSALVNAMHEGVRDPNDRSARYRTLWPKSFYSIRETTDQWLTLTADGAGDGRYHLLNRLDQASLKFRNDHGADLYLGDLLAIHTATGLPIVRETPKGLAAVPFFSSVRELTPEEVNRQAEEVMREYLAGPDWDKPTTDTPTGNPWPFLQEAVKRRIDQDGARLFFEGGPVRCPLTVGLGANLPCGPRRRACEEVTRVDDLPSEGCRMRQQIIDLPRRPAP
ncbi:hypothetical protein ACWGB8_31335 [Kitasatospora sp. NPDC054939]